VSRREYSVRGGRLATAALGLVLVVLLSACQTVIHVGVDVKGDGSGTVTVTAHLDHDAASSYAQYVRTSDLAKAGWKVTGPTPGAGGGVDFTATKAFADPVQAEAVVTEVSGPTGPFRDLAIVRRASFFQTTTKFAGTVDLTCGLDCFSDPQLRTALGTGAGNGLDPSTLQADAGVILDRIFQFEVAARLPGDLRTSNAPSQLRNGAVWKVSLGQKAVLTAQSMNWNVLHIVIVMVGGLLVLAVAGFAVVRFWRRRRARPAA
jgi:hypothetical protein